MGAGAKPYRVRVQGQRGFNSLYSPTMKSGAYTPYAVSGYFQNDGHVAHVIRLGGPASQTASAVWDLSNPTQLLGSQLDGGFCWSRFTFRASSPGCWANKAQITLSYSRQGVSGTPSIDVVTMAAGELTETIRGIQPSTLVDQINKTSMLIRVRHVEGARLPGETGLASLSATATLPLEGGSDDPPSMQSYLDAIQSMGDEPEVALVVMPDLYDDITDPTERLAILASAVALADSEAGPAGDRGRTSRSDGVSGRHQLGCGAPEGVRRGEHPGGSRHGTRGGSLSPLALGARPAGNDARGVAIADRAFGPRRRSDQPARSPARRRLYAGECPPAPGVRRREDLSSVRGAVLNDQGVDLIRCFPNQGLLVWGGRTLGTDPGTLYVAHRRLLHRLVRAIRAVAEPLVFDVNGPELWLTLVRAITTVLLQVYRAGGLAGATPAQAFQVQCDDQTNPSDAIDAGRVVCLVSVAPAVPMEFITLRVSLDTEGRLEVLQ